MKDVIGGEVVSCQFSVVSIETGKIPLSGLRCKLKSRFFSKGEMSPHPGMLRRADFYRLSSSMTTKETPSPPLRRVLSRVGERRRTPQIAAESNNDTLKTGVGSPLRNGARGHGNEGQGKSLSVPIISGQSPFAKGREVPPSLGCFGPMYRPSSMTTTRKGSHLQNFIDSPSAWQQRHGRTSGFSRSRE